jgi:hypothetical protein
MAGKRTKKRAADGDATADDEAGEIRAASTRAALEAQHKRSIRETWWPPIVDEESARKTARYGFWAAVINVLLTGFLIAVLLVGGAKSPLGTQPGLLWWAVADFAVFAAVAAGLYVYSRIAALAGLLLFVASKAYGWLLVSQTPEVGALLIAALFVIFYIHGVRGTFARARWRAAA